MHTESTAPSSISVQFMEDHRRLEGLLQQLLSAFDAGDGGAVQQLWARLDASLTRHMSAEESFLIPALLRSSEHREAGERILAEHERLRAHLLDLGVGVDLHMVRAEAAHAFAEELRAHARGEEASYAWADAHLEMGERHKLVEALTRLMPIRRARGEGHVAK